MCCSDHMHEFLVCAHSFRFKIMRKLDNCGSLLMDYLR